VLFFPTQAAVQLMRVTAGNPVEIKDWMVAKEQILDQLRAGKAGNYEDLLANLLSRIPELRSPLIFITELITALVLMLTSIQDAPEICAMLDRLKQIGLPRKISLSVMSGIAMLLSVIERVNRHYSTILLAQFNRYEDALLQLNEESRRLLEEFTREVVQIISS
jgi:hypothetical protein